MIQLGKAPVDKSGVRAFINMAGFYRRHIDHLADRAVEMTNLLLKKNAPFKWKAKHE